jgi:hypothetical protein
VVYLVVGVAEKQAEGDRASLLARFSRSAALEAGGALTTPPVSQAPLQGGELYFAPPQDFLFSLFEKAIDIMMHLKLS